MNNEEILDRIPIDFGGGCSLSKADLMSYLIKEFRIKASIDIGIYRGRSFFPQANAHNTHTGGTVYGVDPYMNELVREKDNKELKKAIDKFVKEVDFSEIYKDVKKLIKNLGFGDSAKIVRKTSNDAVRYFQQNSIKAGLIHIDGNHDKQMVIDDVENYASLLEEDGFVVMDDISWSSVKPGIHLLESKGFYQVFSRVNLMNDFAVYTNNGNKRKNKKTADKLYRFCLY